MCLFVIFLCSLLLGLSYEQPDICPYQECTCNQTVIDCSYRALKNLPTRLNPGENFTTLLLNGNNITALNGSDSLPSKLESLDLSNNPLTYISNETFRSVAQTLRAIKIKFPRSRSLPLALEQLVNLETLDIEETPLYPNDLTTISAIAKNIKTLRLANIRPLRLEDWLKKFILLRKLYLDGSDLSNNLPVGFFDIWRFQLTHLSLSRTMLSSTIFLSDLERLEWLDLSNTRIDNSAQLSYNLVPLSNSLKFLNLSSNHLRDEPRLVGMHSLTDVILSFSELMYVSSGAFPLSTTNINLDNNRFASIPAIIRNFPQLKNLSIRANQITILGAHDFPVNSSLIGLYVGGNPITVIEDHTFDNLKASLTYLDIENTRLTRLPLMLNTLQRLQTLWIPNNAQLVCTCNEKALYIWQASLPNLQIVGKCGNVEVKEFIGQLASQCP